MYIDSNPELWLRHCHVDTTTAPEVGTISRQSLVYKITPKIPSQTIAEVAKTTATFYTIASYKLRFIVTTV